MLIVFNNTQTFTWKLFFHGYFTIKNENLHHFIVLSEMIIILFILFYYHNNGERKNNKLNHRPQRYINGKSSLGRIIMRFFINLTPRRRGGVLAGTAAVTTTSPRGALPTLPHVCKINRYIVLYFILQTKLFTSFVRFVDIS